MVMVALLVIVVLSYGVFGWCMRALCTLIGYHNSLLVSAMTVMALLLSWRVGTEVNGACGYDTVALVTIVVMSCAAYGWCMRALCTLICFHTSFVIMFIVTSVHALAMLLWRVRTKLTKLVSIGAAHHFKLILVAIIHCYTLVLRWLMAQLKSIHRDKKVKLVLEAVTHVLWLWMMRSKLDGIKSNVRLVVVITTTFLYVDPMPLLPVGLLVKSVDDDMRPMTMSMSSDGGVHGQTVMIRLQEGKLKHSWANSHDPSAGKLAKAIIDQILEFNKVGDPDVIPDTITVKSVINAGWRAEAILGQQS